MFLSLSIPLVQRSSPDRMLLCSAVAETRHYLEPALVQQTTSYYNIENHRAKLSYR